MPQKPSPTPSGSKNVVVSPSNAAARPAVALSPQPVSLPMSSPLMHTEPSGIAVPDAGYAAAGTSADAVIAREAIVKVLKNC